jgi:hypothetical protein
VRSLTVPAVLVFVAAACGPVGDSSGSAGATPNGTRITRPSTLLMRGGDAPVLLRAVPEAGSFVLPYRGGWRYDGRQGTLAPAAPAAQGVDHPSPNGMLTAIERESLTPAGYSFSKELAIRDRPGGPEHTIYRAPVMFYWLAWSPDGRFIALWEIDQYSGSIDQDGRPLLVVDTASGAKIDLGKTLLFGTTAWKPPHTLAFVSGGFRMLWGDKSLRLWSPEDGVRDVSPLGAAAFAPSWSGDGRTLYFASGPSGQYDPLRIWAGRGPGDRSISVYSVASEKARPLAHEPGYVEEGARASRSGDRLLVLRRQTIEATGLAAIPRTPLEIWLTDSQGARGTPLLRFPDAFGAYGWLADPNDWEWSE